MNQAINKYIHMTQGVNTLNINMVNIVVRSNVVDNRNAMDSLSNEDVLEQNDGNEGVAVEKKKYEPGVGNVGRCKKSCAKKNYSIKEEMSSSKESQEEERSSSGGGDRATTRSRTRTK